MADLRSLDATAMIQAMDARRIGALEFLDASIAQSNRLKDKLNAVVAEDLESARAAARIIDDRRAKGETSDTIGLLAGVPMTVKDTFDVDGLPASSGLKAYLGRAAGDAGAVGRARTEGAVIWGKTNVPVLAGDWQSYNKLYGTTNNPWDLERTPGGSSGGAAAALAAGITPLDIGSDIGGSLRVPANFCGVYAHKPTYGLVSQRGHVPPKPGTASEPDLNVVGPMARSARDLRLLLSILANGPIPARAPPAILNSLKVGLWIEEPQFALDAEVRTVIETFAADLGAAGAAVQRVETPVDARELIDVYMQLLYPIIMVDQPRLAAADRKPGARPGQVVRRRGALGPAGAGGDPDPPRMADRQRTARPVRTHHEAGVREVRRPDRAHLSGDRFRPRSWPVSRAQADVLGRAEDPLRLHAELDRPRHRLRASRHGHSGGDRPAGPAGGGADHWPPRRRFQDAGRSPGHRGPARRIPRTEFGLLISPTRKAERRYGDSTLIWVFTELAMKQVSWA